MPTKQSILNILKQARPTLAAKYGIKAIGLFGSYSRADASAASDIDVVVDFVKPIGIRFIDLADELETLLNNKVDLVSLKAIKPKYLRAIEQEVIYV